MHANVHQPTHERADAWPAILVESAELPARLDPVVSRVDGTFQRRAGTWSRRRFVGEACAGDVNRQAERRAVPP